MDTPFTHEDGKYLIRPRGEITLHNVHHLRDALSALLGEGGYCYTLDLGEVTRIDSSGIGAILWFNLRLKELGISFQIVKTPPAVMEIMRLTGLTGILPVAAPTPSLSRSSPRTSS
jgi:anti-sigma B factor antagonist